MAISTKIDPVTRIEGHLAVDIEVEHGRISDARCKGEMFRGFELILKGRDPLDAQQITQRICGVCPVSHGTASILAQDRAYGIVPPTNGRLVRNLILGANYIQSHILHFYQLSALDFVDIAAITRYKGRDGDLCALKQWVRSQMGSGVLYPAAPFLPRYEGRYLQDGEQNIMAIRNYLEGLKMRALAHRMAAVLAGKLPHAPALVPGGVTETVSSEKIAVYTAMLSRLRRFIDSQYLADVVAVAGAFPEYLSIGRGCGNFMAYGAFPESDGDAETFFPGGVLIDDRLGDLDIRKITEDVRYAYYASDSGRHPTDGRTEPSPGKPGAYSWLKAPRYGGAVVEVGPLARLLIAYHQGRDQTLKTTVDDFLAAIGATPAQLGSVLGRHAARALECKLIADRCARWAAELKPGAPAFTDFDIPASGAGVGLTEAPRGALGHWLRIENHKIAAYQCVVPTTWNCSPRDDGGRPGPVESALIGTPVGDARQPLEAVRVVRSFDPCIACAVH